MSDASLKYVVIGETSGAAMDEIMAVYPLASFTIRPWADGLLD